MVRNYEAYQADIARQFGEVGILRRRLAELENIVRERATVGVDVGLRDASHVIVIGRYNGRDYVQTFDVPETELRFLIDNLRHLARTATIRRVDGPPHVKAVFEREFEREFGRRQP